MGRHITCDLTDAERTRAVLLERRPEAVIHAQALSDVDRCEREPELAAAMNVRTVANLVQALRATKSVLIAVSTDYVFDGTKGVPYDESDEPHPVNMYGRSKLDGERVALAYDASVVVRPSTLFGPGRMNFCDHIVACVQHGHTIDAFADQVTSPTYTEDLADGIARLLETVARSLVAEWPSRVVHMANAGACSRIEFAQRVVDLLGGPRSLIRAIRMAEQARPAPRPPYSALVSVHVPQLIGQRLRPWDEALQAYLFGRHA